MLNPKRELQIRINLDSEWPEHKSDKELALLILGSLKRTTRSADSLNFLSDGEQIICPTRRMKAAIQELFEAVFKTDLTSTNYNIRLSAEEAEEVPYDTAHIGIIFNEIVSKLPHDPSPIWSDGQWILCKQKDTANIIADFLDDVAEGRVTTTGYLNPVVDMPECGYVDRLAGYHYVDIA